MRDRGYRSGEEGGYITPNETTVDSSLLQGNFLGAERYAGQIIDRHRNNPPSTLEDELFHVVVKKLSMPLYVWARENTRETEYVIECREILGATDVYGDIVDLLQKVRRIDRETHHNTTAAGRYVGYESELTILALFCRQLSDRDQALRAALPTRKEIDIGTTTEDGLETGIDFSVFNTRTCQITPLQVKTGYSSYNYRDDILVISAIEIAGGNYHELQQLQSALVAETTGVGTPKQISHINRATSSLIQKVASSERKRLSDVTEVKL